jgi:hypothetical protein|tara:strand:- start:907 stop:1059 length:153 start_codon:yes stop_codon:yes gene_type:complete
MKNSRFKLTQKKTILYFIEYYERLLKNKKIENGGAAHNRLKELYKRYNKV